MGQEAERGGAQGSSSPSIDGVIETNRREALADPANAGKSTAQAVQERLQKLLSIRGEDPWSTLGDELKQTHRAPSPAAPWRRCSTATSSSVPRGACSSWSSSGSIDADKIADLLRELRRAGRPRRAGAGRRPERAGHREGGHPRGPGRGPGRIATSYTKGLIAEVRRHPHRQGPLVDDLVESRDEENQPMLTHVVARGGRMLEVEELEFAIARKNVDLVNAVLERQPTQAKMFELVSAYEFKQRAGQPAGRCSASAATPSWRPPPTSTSPVPCSAAATPRIAAEALDKPGRWAATTRPTGSPSTGSGSATSRRPTSGLMGALREMRRRPRDAGPHERVGHAAARRCRPSSRPTTRGAGRAARSSPRCAACGRR